MDYKAVYQEWLHNDFFNEEIKADLEAIKHDEAEIQDRFIRCLSLGQQGFEASWCWNQPHEYLHGW